MLTALALKRCMEVDWCMTAIKDGFIRYYFTCGQVFRLEEEYVQVSNRIRGNRSSFTTLILAAVPRVFQTDRRRVDISHVRHNFDRYRGVNVNPELASGVVWVALFDQYLL